MARPIHAQIDLAALTHNLQVIKQMASHSKVMAVVKSNAYGHGVVAITQALTEADAFAVASLGEALELRYADIRKRIVLLEGVFSSDELHQAALHGLDIVVHNMEQLVMLQQYHLSAKFNIWLKIDTGMHRLGFQPSEVSFIYHQLISLICVQQVSVITHFAAADRQEHPLNTQQIIRFAQAIKDLPLDIPKSLANSAAIINFPQHHAEWVRPGIMLYGVSPLAEQTADDLGLRPVMTLRSEVIALRSIEAGEVVGYDGSWQATRASKIAIIAGGYGDGYSRHAKTGTPVYILGSCVPIIGRISMDMMAIDVTDLPCVVVGTSVTLWGDKLPVSIIADYAGTIAYELLCAITPRVPRYD